MITLHLSQYLADNGFGRVALTGSETGNDLIYFEKLPLGKTGLFIMSNPTSLTRGQRTSQSFDIYARGRNDLEGGQKLGDILQFFLETYHTCDLPTVPGYSDKQYKDCVITPSSNISNLGVDATDRVIYSVSATIIYTEV